MNNAGSEREALSSHAYLRASATTRDIASVQPAVPFRCSARVKFRVLHSYVLEVGLFGAPHEIPSALAASRTSLPFATHFATNQISHSGSFEVLSSNLIRDCAAAFRIA